MAFIGLFIGLIGMEGVTYIVHRFVFHGFLWHIHETHHKPDDHTLELNDIFGLVFAVIAMALIILAVEGYIPFIFFGLGLGITAYGLLYFFIHDVLTHRRFFKLKTSSSWLQRVVKAHNVHHTDFEKTGKEPYGLFLFDPELIKSRKKKNRA